MKYLLAVLWLFMIAVPTRADGVYDVMVHTFPATADGNYSISAKVSIFTLSSWFIASGAHDGGNFALADEDVVGVRGHDVIDFNGYVPYYFSEGKDVDLYPMDVYYGQIDPWFEHILGIASIVEYAPRHELFGHTVVTPEPSTLVLLIIGTTMLLVGSLCKKLPS